MHNQKAVDGFEGARRVTQTIGMHVKNMTAAELDHALNVWDSLLKSGLTRSPNKIKTVETSDYGRQDNQNVKEIDDMKKSQQKDALMARGRAFVKMGYSPREAAKLALEPAKRHVPWGSTPHLWGREDTMVDDTPLPGPQAPQLATKQAPQSLGPAFFGYEKKRDVTKLTGHQQAALKAGVDIDKVPAANLERMDKGQMQALALEQQRARVEAQRVSQPLRDHPGPWGTMLGLGQRR